ERGIADRDDADREILRRSDDLPCRLCIRTVRGLAQDVGGEQGRHAMSVLKQPLSGSLSSSLLNAAKRGEPALLSPEDGKSHVSGDRSLPLKRATVPQMLAEAVSRHGPRDAA